MTTALNGVGANTRNGRWISANPIPILDGVDRHQEQSANHLFNNHGGFDGVDGLTGLFQIAGKNSRSRGANPHAAVEAGNKLIFFIGLKVVSSLSTPSKTLQHKGFCIDGALTDLTGPPYPPPPSHGRRGSFLLLAFEAALCPAEGWHVAT